MAEPHPHRLGYEDSLKLSTSLCLTYILCTAVLRVWVRRSMFGIDDGVIAAAIVICIVQLGISYAAIVNGAGLPWTLVSGSERETLNGVSHVKLLILCSSTYCGLALRGPDLYLHHIALSHEVLCGCFPPPPHQELYADPHLPHQHCRLRCHWSSESVTCDGGLAFRGSRQLGSLSSYVQLRSRGMAHRLCL